MICEGCAVGRHCSVRFNKSELLNPTNTNKKDAEFIKEFKKLAAEMGLEGGIEDIIEIATFSNAGPREVTSLLTDAGTVRKVLSSGELYWRLAKKRIL